MFEASWGNTCFVATRQLAFSWLTLNRAKIGFGGDQMLVVFETNWFGKVSFPPSVESTFALKSTFSLRRCRQMALRPDFVIKTDSKSEPCLKR